MGPHELGDIGGMVKVVKYHFTLFSFYLVLFFVESIPVNLSLCRELQLRIVTLVG